MALRFATSIPGRVANFFRRYPENGGRRPNPGEETKFGDPLPEDERNAADNAKQMLKTLFPPEVIDKIIAKVKILANLPTEIRYYDVAIANLESLTILALKDDLERRFGSLDNENISRTRQIILRSLLGEYDLSYKLLSATASMLSTDVSNMYTASYESFFATNVLLSPVAKDALDKPLVSLYDTGTIPDPDADSPGAYMMMNMPDNTSVGYEIHDYTRAAVAYVVNQHINDFERRGIKKKIDSDIKRNKNVTQYHNPREFISSNCTAAVMFERAFRRLIALSGQPDGDETFRAFILDDNMRDAFATFAKLYIYEQMVQNGQTPVIRALRATVSQTSVASVYVSMRQNILNAEAIARAYGKDKNHVQDSDEQMISDFIGHMRTRIATRKRLEREWA